MRIAKKTKNLELSPNKAFIIKSKRTAMSNRGKATKKVFEITDVTTDDVISSAIAGVSLEEKHRLIAEAAYYRAERRRFAPGYELEDWLKAEAEVETIISKHT